MDLFSIPRLVMDDLQTVGGSIFSITEPFAAIGGVRAAAVDCYNSFKLGMTKNQASAETKQGTDIVRDGLLTGLTYHAKSQQYYPHTELVKQALAKLTKVLDDYKVRQIRRLSFSEETSAIDNLLTEIGKLDLSALKVVTGLLEWFELIAEANNNARKASENYAGANVDAADVDAASTLAPKLTDCLESIIVVMYGLLKINDNEAMRKAYLQIKELVDSYR